MKNIIFHIKGVSDSLIVLGAYDDAVEYRIDISYPGADDNMSGVAVLLKVIKDVQEIIIRPKYNIEICFFDGEEIGRYGSTHFVSTCNKDIKLYINVHTCGNADCQLGLYYSQYSSHYSEIFRDMINELHMINDWYDPINYTTDCEPFEKKAFLLLHSVVLLYLSIYTL